MTSFAVRAVSSATPFALGMISPELNFVHCCPTTLVSKTDHQTSLSPRHTRREPLANQSMIFAPANGLNSVKVMLGTVVSPDCTDFGEGELSPS